MAKIKEFLKNHALVLVILLGAMVAGANYLIYPTLIKKDLNLVDVPVASVEISETSEVNELMITTISVTEEFLSDNIVTDKDEIIGMYVAENCTIPAGAFFYRSELTDRKTIYGEVANALEEGQAAYTVELDAVDASTNAYKVNQTISLYGTVEYEGKNGYRTYAFGELVHEAKIIAVAVNSSTGIAEKLTLAVDTEDLAYLHLVDELGELNWHLPYQYSEDECYDTAEFRKFIDENTTIFRTGMENEEKEETVEVYAVEEQQGEE